MYHTHFETNTKTRDFFADFVLFFLSADMSNYVMVIIVIKTETNLHPLRPQWIVTF